MQSEFRHYVRHEKPSSMELLDYYSLHFADAFTSLTDGKKIDEIVLAFTIQRELVHWELKCGPLTGYGSIFGGIVSKI